MKNKIRSIVLLLVFFLSGCMLEFEDVSNEPRYASLLNKPYFLDAEMRVVGVYLGPGYKKRIDVYIVKPISLKTVGPEIISEAILNKGVVLTVKNVRRSTTSVLLEGKLVMAVVTAEPFVKDAEVSVEIDLKYLQSSDYMHELR